MKELDKLSCQVKTRADLADFITALARDLEVNRSEWGHDSLSGFLDVLSDTVRTIDRIYQNEGRTLDEETNWRVLADILLAARVRE